MNRWRSIISWLLIAVTINSVCPYAVEEEYNAREDSTISVSGEASGDSSGDISGEGEKKVITISFYKEKTLLKSVQIEKGSTVELWTPECTELEAFVGWCFMDSDGYLGARVKESTRFYEDTQLYAEIYPTMGTMYRDMIEEQEKIANLQKQLQHTHVYIKNIKVKNNKSISLKVRSSRIPSSTIEIQYTTSRPYFFEGRTKTMVVKRTKNKSVKRFKKVTIKKLKKNKTYYIRARVKIQYQSQYNDKPLYSYWSKVKKVEMKKKKK